MNMFKEGLLLISDPFLKDVHFSRSVILLTEVAKETTMGFVLNKMYEKTLDQLIESENNINFNIYNGGPVQQDTLHFLHKRPDLIDNGTEVCEGVFWGGNFDKALSLVKDKILTPNDIRFFIGYSGWDNNQLIQEFEENTWLIHQAKTGFVFHKNCATLWKETVIDMGGEFSKLSNYPIDPQLN